MRVERTGSRAYRSHGLRSRPVADHVPAVSAARAASRLRAWIDEANLQKLVDLQNESLLAFAADAVELLEPASVFVATDAASDLAALRAFALEAGEESPLTMEGHTVHFDGYQDQGRDPLATKYLVPFGEDVGARLNSIPRAEGLRETRDLMEGAMRGRRMLIRFLVLGPPRSTFAIPCVQITDSAYVAHNEDLLYRPGYEAFREAGPQASFFRFVHAAGRMARGVSVDWQNRRVSIDLQEETVYAVNTQYAGNTVGLKKLALRLAIRKAEREGWLAEHMFLMGAKGPGNRTTYFLGAFPSACGKTSTAMMPGQSILGDDLAYLRNVGGEARAVNVERGIFGIIRDVNARDDPMIWSALTRPGEVIFSNVLVRDGHPYWTGMGKDLPPTGTNHSGEWWSGKKDADGEAIPPSHPNARFTLRLEGLPNLDSCAEDPDGVTVDGVIYGGRDPDTWVPVQQAFDWAHGVAMLGASIESETTAATLGETGVRKFNPMSNLDFLSVPLGRYVEMHFEFGRRLRHAPAVFSVNYFLKGPDGRYLNDKLDKRVWLQWMERRVHGEVGAIRTPVGWIPQYEDLQALFLEQLGKEYSRDAYASQFAIRVPPLLAKAHRIEAIYRSESGIPLELFEQLASQKARLEALAADGGMTVSPFDFT